VRVASVFLFFWLAICAGFAGVPSITPQSSAPASQGAAALQPGVLLPGVVTLAAPSQTYALYLPAAYTPAKRWPILYVFDPDANGEVPAALIKAAAEQFGYIVAASNNSRNGPWSPDAQAAQAMWNDTHDRLSLDDQRVYFAGFSGGARVAARLAQSCKCAQALFLNGAGFPTDSPPSNKDSFAVFTTAGLFDFNYPELVGLDARLETLGLAHFLRRFDGAHQWAPAEIWPEALAWADLLAMKAQRRPRDDAFIAAQLANFSANAQKYEQAGDLAIAWQSLRATSATFAGLSDVSALQAQLAALEKNPALRAAQKREKNEVAQQQALEAAIYSAFAPIASPDADRNDISQRTTTEIALLRGRAAQENNPAEHRVLERARRGVSAYFLEGGEPLIDSPDPRLARIYLAMAAEARPENAWTQVLLARCDSKMGRRKDALRDLQKAVTLGLGAKDLAQLPDTYGEFAPLRTDAEFLKLLAAAKPTG